MRDKIQRFLRPLRGKRAGLARQRSRAPGWLVGLLSALALLAGDPWGRSAAAHDLQFSRLVLRIEATRVVGELTTDPAKHPTPADATLEARQHAVERAAEKDVTLYFDERASRAAVAVLDVARPGDSQGVDIVELVWKRPARARSLSVRPDPGLGDLAVSVEQKTARGAHSVLVRGGERSPPYGLTATLPAPASSVPPVSDPTLAWQVGGVDVLAPSASAAPAASSSVGPASMPTASEPPVAEPSADPEPSTPGFHEPWQSVLWRYLVLGVEHIVPLGLDHILFCVGLVLLARRLRELVLWVSLFTVAHTLTLALGALGIVGLSPTIVEPLIAFSIAYVGLERVLVKEPTRWTRVVVFGFGLLHGLGFAGVLTELGLARERFVLSLLSFNLGVELGQLVVVSGTSLLLFLMGRREGWREPATRWAAFAISAVGLVWGMSRALEGW